jgi:hypothetical protein
MRAFVVQLSGLVGFVAGAWLEHPGIAATGAALVFVGLALEDR